MEETTYSYTGSAQTWDTTDVTQATVTLNGPAGGTGQYADNGETLGGDGGYVQATLDLSAYDSVEVYVAEQGHAGADHGGDAAGGWGYVTGEEPPDTDAGGGGGLTALVAGDGTVLAKAGGGGGGGETTDPGGRGADWQSVQADGSTVGGDVNVNSTDDGGPGTGWVISTATEVTITEGGGATYAFGETSHGEVTVLEGTSTTVAPQAASGTTTAPTPAVDGIQAPVTTPPAATATTTASPPTIETTLGTIVSPAAATADTSAPVPTIRGSTPTTISPAPATATTTAVPPTIESVINTIYAPAATATATAHEPTVTSTQNPTISPPTATATASAVSDVSVGVYTSISPPAATAEGMGIVPLVGKQNIVTPPVATATASAPVPSISQPVTAMVTPAPASADASAGAPHVEAVSPLETIPAAVVGKTDTADTGGQFMPDISAEVTATDEPAFEGQVADNHRYRESRNASSNYEIEPSRDPPQRLTTEDASAYTPVKQLFINGEEITVDRDIKVSASEYGFAVADCTLYNLEVEHWHTITRSDTVRIDLGWAGVGTETIFEGEVIIKRQRDHEFVIRARDKAGDIVTSRFTRSYTDLSPHRIVEQLIAEINGLGRGYIDVGSERIKGTYTLSGGRELGDWLDKLSALATDQTGNRWVWYLEDGNLYFHPAKVQVTDHVGFSMEKSVQRVRPVGLVGNRKTQQKYEMFTRCEPLVRRGLTCTIADADTIEESQVFRVASYTHDSSTTTGRHHTSATLEPMFKEIDDIIR